MLSCLRVLCATGACVLLHFVRVACWCAFVPTCVHGSAGQVYQKNKEEIRAAAEHGRRRARQALKRGSRVEVPSRAQILNDTVDMEWHVTAHIGQALMRTCKLEKHTCTAQHL